MARPETTRKVDDDCAADSIPEFCRKHRISVPLFYKLKRLGLGPDTFYAGTRHLVGREAQARWRHALEQKQAAKEATEV